MTSRVLTISDNPSYAQALALQLGLFGHEASASGAELPLVLRSAFSFRPDALVLDLSREGRSELFAELRRVIDLPIIVLGIGRSDDVVVWYIEQGAHAYIAKPVSPKVLCAHLEARVLRTEGLGQGEPIKVNDLEIDLAKRRVLKRDTVIRLTRTEFWLLQILAKHRGRTCSSQLLAQHVWAQSRASRHYLKVYIWRLRQKLEDTPDRPRLLVTDWGLGYRLVDSDREVEVAPMPVATRVVVPTLARD